MQQNFGEWSTDEVLDRMNGLYVAGDVGEKAVFTLRRRLDAEALGREGFSVVCGWTSNDLKLFRGKDVFVLDNDEAAAKELYAYANTVRIVTDENVVRETIARGTDISPSIVELAGQAQIWTPPRRTARAAADFGEDNTKFLWYPYLPVGDYSVLMADGGTGKTILCCGIAADVSTGSPLPGDEFTGKGQNVLLVSAEDSGELLKKRLKRSGANLEKVFILDRSDSAGMNFAENFDEFEATVKAYSPALVVVDPWHAYIGARTDISRANAVRPIFQKIANMAKRCDCSVILVSHVNKRSQGENANNAATGSSDFINAARSAFRVIFDEDDDSARIMVHTKSNYAEYGNSVRYIIEDGGMRWDGFSEITRQTLEAAARRKTTPQEVLQKDDHAEAASKALVDAVENSANQFVATRFTYDEFRDTHGELIFGGRQPKRALDAIKERLTDDGYFLKTGIQVKKGRIKGNGFLVQRLDMRVGTQNELPSP